VGDFNLDESIVLPHFENFDIAVYSPRKDAIGILRGKPSRYSSKQQVHFYQPTILPVDMQDPTTPEVYCGGVDVLWTDHCSVFVKISPVPPK
jgi:hypothetical protein